MDSSVIRGLWWFVFDDSDYFFVCCAPDCCLSHKVWVGVCVVELDHCFCWEELTCLSEFVDDWLEFFDDVFDCRLVFMLVLYDDS